MTSYSSVVTRKLNRTPKALPSGARPVTIKILGLVPVRFHVLTD